jgi:hypothetical protein
VFRESQKTEGYCWRTPTCRNLCLAYAVVEDTGTWRIQRSNRGYIAVEIGSPTVSGGFFYCPDEAIDHRDRRQIMLECGQIIRKITDQRRSAIRTDPQDLIRRLMLTKRGMIVPA